MSADKSELRCAMDADLLQALDMIALSFNGMPRSSLVENVLRAYVAKKQRQAMLVAKAPQINPPGPDSQWSDL